MTARIAIIIPSLGRPGTVLELTRRLARQTRAPDRVCVCIANPEDAPNPEERAPAEIVGAPLGSCSQRNAGLERIGKDADLIVFFDDDFVPAPDYLEQLEGVFRNNPKLAGATGRVLRDGATGPGLTFDDADRAIAAFQAPPPGAAHYRRRVSLYGCNMAFRREAIEGLRFDENLPLYGWLEDVDFSVQAGRAGLLVETDAIAGVHLGVKGGRTSGLRFGYSQVVNPIYLRRKGTMTFTHAAENIGRTMIANHLRAMAPEPYVDRWGRVKGNWAAIRDVVSGKLDPARILSF